MWPFGRQVEQLEEPATSPLAVGIADGALDVTHYGRLDYSAAAGELARLQGAKYCCDVCGFASLPSRQVPHGYMRVDPLTNNVLCAFCFAATYTDIPVGYGPHFFREHGMLVYVPWLNTQGELTQLCRELMVVSADAAHPDRAHARSALEHLRSQAEQFGLLFDGFAGELTMFEEIVHLVPENNKANAALAFAGWFYAPLEMAFQPALRYWMKVMERKVARKGASHA